MGKSVDQAILKVTYMLTSISGVEKAENKKVFKEITKGFSWFSPGDPETDQFVLDIIKTTEELAKLKEHYDDDDYFSAFLSRIKPECETIRNDSDATARKAFVIWIAICLADKELSEFENMALLALQRYMNFGTFTKEKSCIEPNVLGVRPTMGLIGRPIMGLIVDKMPQRLVGKKLPKGSYDVLETQGKLIISDTFMHETLEIIKLMGALKTEIDATSDEDQKKSLQLSYDILQKQLESKILND